jgi:hypothetical protein
MAEAWRFTRDFLRTLEKVLGLRIQDSGCHPDELSWPSNRGRFPGEAAGEATIGTIKLDDGGLATRHGPGAAESIVKERGDV